MIARDGIFVTLVGLGLASVANAAPKILDTPMQLSLRGGYAGTSAMHRDRKNVPHVSPGDEDRAAFDVTAAWQRSFNGARIPVEKRALLLSMVHDRIDFVDCHEITVSVDEKPIASTLTRETGAPTCTTTPHENLVVRIERAAMAPLTQAKSLSIDLCGEELVVDPQWLPALVQLVKRALADK